MVQVALVEQQLSQSDNLADMKYVLYFTVVYIKQLSYRIDLVKIDRRNTVRSTLYYGLKAR